MVRRKPNKRQQSSAKPAGPKQEFIVEGLTHEAKGVARNAGKVTFIDGALPRETVEAQVTKPGKNYDIAILNRILTHSPHRVIPPCIHYDACGGCSFQHLEGKQQLAAKHQWLVGQLRKVLQHQTIDILSDRAFGYRRRARIAVIAKEDKTVLGFRGKGSNQIVSIENCIVLTEPLQQLYVSLKSKLIGNPLVTKLGHIELLEDEQGVSVLFRLTEVMSTELILQWQQWAQKNKVAMYWQSPAAKRAQLEDGELRHYNIDGMSLRYHPQDFIQVNSAMNKLMVAQAMDWLALTEDDVVLDLFCGVGNFSLPLAKRAKKVVGIEVQESMVAAARYNAQQNGLANVSFIAADLTQAIAGKFSNLGVTKILLDPPRAGAKEFLDTIIAIKPQQILYVSCDAATLARDAEYLVNNGFEVLRVTMMNMFPQTSHVETMMLLRHR
jgi:23S rRNA (uracil1939-C5)-methyltransferase